MRVADEPFCSSDSSARGLRALALQPLVLAAPPSGQAIVVFAVFLTAQILDGLLTYAGVTLFGIGVEANTLLATSMQAIGTSRALLSAKLLACVCGYVLFRTGWHRPLAIVTGLYLGVAIVPWLLILSIYVRLQ